MADAFEASPPPHAQSRSRPGVDCLSGEWRRPRNDLQHQRVGGGHKAIHDEDTAVKVGFAVAPIHGTVHWSQFLPLLLEAFGHAWFESGSLSVHFVTPVGHLEPVKAYMSKPDPSKAEQQVSIWMEHADGRVVLNGTASMGSRAAMPKTMARSRLDASKPFEGNLVFARHPVGTKSMNVETAVINFDQEVGPLFPFTLNQKLEIITEFHPWFTEEGGKLSPWGRAVLPPEALNQIMLGVAGSSEPAQWPERPEDAWLESAMGGRTPVGLFGGCEVVIHSGPVFVGEQFDVRREVVGRGETPRAEFMWVRTSLMKRGSTELVAEMTLQEMMLKDSFEGYADLRRRSDSASAHVPASRL